MMKNNYDFELPDLTRIHADDDHVLEFPFPKYWIAVETNRGEIVTDLFWKVVDSLNRVALGQYTYSMSDMEALIECNEAFTNWGLRTFPCELYGSCSKDKILPFPS